jgi:hypothetical protein
LRCRSLRDARRAGCAFFCCLVRDEALAERARNTRDARVRCMPTRCTIEPCVVRRTSCAAWSARCACTTGRVVCIVLHNGAMSRRMKRSAPSTRRGCAQRQLGAHGPPERASRAGGGRAGAARTRYSNRLSSLRLALSP